MSLRKSLIFFFNTATNSTDGSFLKVTCNTESETTAMNFLYTLTLKSVGLSCTMDLYSANIISLSYTALQNTDILPYSISKIPIS